jgi:hypothetical protein
MLIPLLNYSHINTWTGWADGGNVTAQLAFAQGAPSSELRLASIVLPNKTNNATAHLERLSYFHEPAIAGTCVSESAQRPGPFPTPSKTVPAATPLLSRWAGGRCPPVRPVDHVFSPFDVSSRNMTVDCGHGNPSVRGWPGHRHMQQSGLV